MGPLYKAIYDFDNHLHPLTNFHPETLTVNLHLNILVIKFDIAFLVVNIQGARHLTLQRSK